jgi:hypothetical protein
VNIKHATVFLYRSEMIFFYKFLKNAMSHGNENRILEICTLYNKFYYHKCQVIIKRSSLLSGVTFHRLLSYWEFISFHSSLCSIMKAFSSRVTTKQLCACLYFRVYKSAVNFKVFVCLKAIGLRL